MIASFAQLKIVAGVILLVVCAGVFGACAIHDVEWRMANRRRRRRRARVEELDLTGVKP